MSPRILVPVFMVATLAIAGPVSAQAPSPVQPGQPSQRQRPYRGLFGGGVGETSQQLVLNISFGAARYESLSETLTSGAALPIDPVDRTGRYATGSANLSYSLSRERVSGGVTVSTHGRYVPERARTVSGTYFATAQMSANFGTRTGVSLAQRTGLYLQNRSAFAGNQLGISADPSAPLDPTAFLDQQTFQSSQTDLQVSFAVTPRTAVNAGYAYYSNDAWSTAGRGRYGVHHGRTGFSFSLAKGLALRLAYGYSESRFGADAALPTYRGRTIDGGLTFNRALSFSRRAILSFSTGAAGLSDRNETRYDLTGHARFGYELGRSWNLTVAYNRSASFDETLGQPVLRDTVHAGANGLIGRRLQTNVGVGLLRGDIGIGAAGSRYTASTVEAGLQFGLHRSVALGANYSFYQHEYRGGQLLPPGLLSRTKGQTVRISLNAWVPLLIRARRP